MAQLGLGKHDVKPRLLNNSCVAEERACVAQLDLDCGGPDTGSQLTHRAGARRQALAEELFRGRLR
eukprot:2670700-Rhodomonas_salina.1